MAPSDRPRPRPTPAPLDEGRPAHILVADDDRVAREMLVAILRNAGHAVEQAEDGQEALERIAQGGVDLVLLDIVMPRLTGLEACRILKGMATDVFVPVILVTVKTDTASRVDGLKIGADDYVCKPFEEQELVARVASMLRIKRLHDHIVAQRAKLERLSIRDEMTGLYNYRYLHTRLNEEFKRAERHHEPFACVVIDIDRLKSHNERAGRPAGDAIIKAVAERLRRGLRDIDIVARYGGEEFLVMLPSTHFAGSITAAQRMWTEISTRPVEFDGKSLEVAASIGVALFPSRDIKTREALLRGADVALAQAKREGGNRICVFQQQGYVYAPALGENVLAHGASRRDAPENVLAHGASRRDAPENVLAHGASRRDAPENVPALGASRRDAPESAGQGSSPPPSRRFDRGDGGAGRKEP